MPRRAEERTMDQPMAEEALKKLEPLVGEWILEARPPDGEPWPGGGRAVFEWHDSRAHLVERSTVELPEGRDGAPFPQRFTATISDDGNTIAGRWEKAEDGTNFTTDFDLSYRRVK